MAVLSFGVMVVRVRGARDDLGISIASDELHMHDLQATILHFLGSDHTTLMRRLRSRDFQHADVHETVVKQLLS